MSYIDIELPIVSGGRSDQSVVTNPKSGFEAATMY